MSKHLWFAMGALASVLASQNLRAAPIHGSVSALSVSGFNVTGMTVDGEVIIGPSIDKTVGTNVRLGAALGQGPERVITAGAAPATQAAAERLVYDRSLQTGYQDTATNVNTFDFVFDSPISNRSRSEFVLIMTTNVGATAQIKLDALDAGLSPIAGQSINVLLPSLAHTTTFSLGTPTVHQFYAVTGFGGSWSTSNVGNFPQALARAVAVNFDANVALGGVRLSQVNSATNHIGVEAYALVPEPSALMLGAINCLLVVGLRRKRRSMES